ncbi:MAG: 3'-5' exonuclease [Candidatus Omnitrophota bacterium]|nr:3'-5' exonuclease [Candidatus Omnitrophota bacterium]MDZ4242760.1 3'-5' exonuclease [Candidatus Omnitrophota bacterium]
MKLSRPLIVLDLETTGTWIEKDRIIEIGMIRCLPGGDRTTYEQKVNPGMPIPAEVQEVTGISDEDVKYAPRFKDIAAEVVNYLEGADLAGFNLERFDMPILAREVADANLSLDFKGRTVYDAQKIYHLHERRDLTAAYKYYCDHDLTDAHSALADSRATLEVLEAQLKKYGNGSDFIEALKQFDYKKRSEFYDADRKFRWWNGELYMMFGKYARRDNLKEVAKNDRSYLEWILTQNFSDEVKDLVERALEGKFPSWDPPGPKDAA